MKPRPVKLAFALLACALLVHGSTSASPPPVRMKVQPLAPAHQLAHAENGHEASLYFVLPEPWAGPSIGVIIEGVEIRRFELDEAGLVLRVDVAGPDNSSVLIDEIMLIGDAGVAPWPVGPSEVAWLDLTPGSLRVPSQRYSGSSPPVLTWLLTNPTEAPLTVRSFHYASRGVATGRMLVAEFFGDPDDFADVTMIHDVLFEGAAGASDTVQPAFREADLNDAHIEIPPGGGVVLVLGGPGFTSASTGLAGTWGIAPWVTYLENGEERNLPMIERTLRLHGPE